MFPYHAKTGTHRKEVIAMNSVYSLLRQKSPRSGSLILINREPITFRLDSGVRNTQSKKVFMM